MIKIDKKALLKNLFFAAAVWMLGFLVVSMFGAAWAAATKQQWLLSFWMIVYMLGSTAFTTWLAVEFFRRQRTTNGKHNGDSK